MMQPGLFVCGGLLREPRRVRRRGGWNRDECGAGCVDRVMSGGVLRFEWSVPFALTLRGPPQRVPRPMDAAAAQSLRAAKTSPASSRWHEVFLPDGTPRPQFTRVLEDLSAVPVADRRTLGE